MELRTYEEIKKHMKKCKVFVVIQGTEIHVQAVKKDVLHMISVQENLGYTGPTNYDGQPSYALLKDGEIIFTRSF